MIDVDKVIGNAVIAPNGATIIPVSQVSFGFVSGGGEYDFENSIVYVLSEDLLPLNYIFEIGNTPSGEYISKITDFSWDDTYIYIVGEAYTPGIVVNENNTVKTTLDISNGSEHNEFNLSNYTMIHKENNLYLYKHN